MKKPITIIVAEDDPDDQLMIKDAFDASQLNNPQTYVANGIELLDELKAIQSKLSDPKSAPSCLILLDLNMPKMDGREALKAIKDDPALRRIPVVVLTTSKADEDIVRSYDLGVSGFISKPVEFKELIEVISGLKRYWLEIVELPTH